MKYVLVYFAIKYKGDFNQIYEALLKNELISFSEIEEVKKQVEARKIKAITILDWDYPQEFKFLAKPPFVIFYEGNKLLLYNKHKICLTGEHQTQNIEFYFNKTLPEVIKKQTLITNYSKAMDHKIVNYFQKNDKPIIYISCNGIENPFFHEPVKVTDQTLIISESPSNVNISRNRLRARNRLVSALGESLVIYSSKKRSQANTLVTEFLNLGKEIYCFPGDISEDDGNNYLISQGAHLITSIIDVN
ncbi:DNA-processing protein DprA [Mycoplasma iguanae]|uniref:DNA-processing protein DprA n=1 Tax=Mycoplasma iguanae TaxID=292461 RepID=A0ABY5R8S1_9MOLU|nr:DNA-processing protein DprA [Mycoplasma iguanae]UVD81839.1 DNA-processing protein DprA [Mycoplasma iguanae]